MGKHIGRFVDHAGVDCAPQALGGDFLLVARGEEAADRVFPHRPRLCRQCRTVVSQPVGPAQGIVGPDLVHPVRQRLVRGRSQPPGHQRVKAPAVEERPDRPDRRFAVSQLGAGPVQPALVELPDEHPIGVAAEGDLLDRYVDMLAQAVAAARIMRGHGPRRGDHVGVECAGIAGFLDRRAVRLAGDAQRAAHR